MSFLQFDMIYLQFQPVSVQFFRISLQFDMIYLQFNKIRHNSTIIPHYKKRTANPDKIFKENERYCHYWVT